jgi:cell division transport system ATP-binding protein
MFSPDSVVSVKETSIFQDHHTVLSDLNFEIQKGEFVYLVGRTGSGKSSLLKTLYADLPVRVGDVSVAGFTIQNIRPSEVPPLRRKLGIIFQDFQLFNDRTVAENLMFVMKATGWRDNVKMRSRVSDVLLQVGLGSVEKKMPHQLSGGEQQRVVIARAMLNEPMILLADEPTGNLDTRTSVEVMGIFQRLNMERGITILLITHELDIAQYATRLIGFRDGRLVFDRPITDRRIAEEELEKLPPSLDDVVQTGSETSSETGSGV